MMTHDIRRYLVAVAQAASQSVGIPAHIDGQNNAPRPNGVYINVSIVRGPRAASRISYTDVDVITSATLTVTPVTPGTNVYFYLRPKSAPQAAHAVVVGDTVTTVRDSLLAQLASHHGGNPSSPNFGAGYWSAAATGVDGIELTPLEFGGLGVDIPAFGLDVATTTTEAQRSSGQSVVTIRCQIRGTARLSATDLESVLGRNSAAAVGATFFDGIGAADVAPILTQAGLEVREFPITGAQVPANVGAEIEWRHTADIEFGCKSLGFWPPRLAASSVGATLGVLSPPIPGADSGDILTENLDITP